MASSEESLPNRIEREFSRLMPISSIPTPGTESDDGVPRYEPRSVDEPSMELRLEDDVRSDDGRENAVHRLKCEKELLEEHVRQLETQIEETRDGLVEIYNHRLSDDAERSQPLPLSDPAQTGHEIESQSANRHREVTFNELIRVIRSWKRHQEALRLENSQLDILIQELQLDHPHQLPSNKTLEFQKNIEWLEDAVTRKIEKITELETRFAALEAEEERLKTQLEECAAERETLLKERETAAASKRSVTKALAESEAKVKSLQHQIAEKDRTQQQLTTQVTDLHALLEKRRKSMNPFKCFGHIPQQKLPPIPSQPTEPPQTDPSENIDPPTVSAPPVEEHREVEEATSATPLLEKQLKSQELHLDELRSQLRREESVRTNLERLLMEGTTLMHSLTSSCKARIRDAQSSIQSIQNSTLRQEREPFLIQELENVIQFLDRVKPLESYSSPDLDAAALFDPPLDPTERRSEPVPMP